MESVNMSTQAEKVVVLENYQELSESIKIAQEILDGNIKELPEITEIVEDLNAFLEYFLDAMDAWETRIDSIRTRSKGQEAEEMRLWIDEHPRSRTREGAKIMVKELKRKLERLLRKRATPDKQIESLVPNREERTFQEQSSSAAQRPEVPSSFQEPVLPRLPSPTLPTFSGVRAEFSAWWEQFEEMIHSRPDITNTDKMRYLRQAIQDSAKTVLAPLTTTSADYLSAIELLHNTFSESKADSITEISKLRNLRLSDSTWASQLSLVTTLKAATTKLSRSQDGLQSSKLMHQLILEKFPQQTKEQLLRFIYDENEVTVDKILGFAERFIKRESFALTMSETQSVKISDSSKRHLVNAGIEEQRFSSQRQKILREGSIPSEDDCTCLYCNGNHLSWSCKTMWRIKDRISFLKEKGLCQGCLVRAGSSHSCNAKCPLCSAPHHISTCYKLISMNKTNKGRKHYNEGEQSKSKNSHRSFPNEEHQQRRERRNQNVNTSSSNASSSTNYNPRLLTGQAKVRSTVDTEINFLLDSGATISLIDEKKAEELQLEYLRSSELTISGLGGETKGKKKYKMYKVPILIEDGTTMTVEAIAHPEPITANLDIEPLSQQDIEFMNSQGIRIPGASTSATQMVPKLLLGNTDFLRCIKWNQEPIRLPSGYLLMDTTLGWIATGSQNDSSHKDHHLISTATDSKCQDSVTLRRFLALDDAVKEEREKPEENSMDQTDRIGCHFKRNVEFKEKRIYAKYCLKEDNLPRLSRNFNSSIARLRNVIESLKSKGLLWKYHEIIMEHLKRGHIEQVTDSEIEARGPTSYLPHHPVFRRDKPSKPIRIVYDASAKERGKLSLNDCMAAGPMQLEHIPALLIRARCASSIVTADVEAAFLQIKVQPDQRNLLRMLWISNPDKPLGNQNLVTYRFTVTPFGISQSPYLLEASISHHVQLCSEEQNADETKKFVLEQLKNNVYVDNIIFECDENTDKRRLYECSKEILAEISMNLREFASDDNAFVSGIPLADQGVVGEQKILGIKWDSKSDKLHLSAMMPFTAQLTKRTVLKKIATPFDPLGLLTPLLLPAKVFVQGLWKKKYDWDTIIQPEDAKMWNKIEREISLFSTHRPRATEISKDNTILAAFVDASFKAIGAAVYILGNQGSEIILARSQLAPIRKTMTIPKLEFKAISLGLQLLTFAAKSIRKSRTHVLISNYIFSDSEIALYWMTDNQKNAASRTVSNIKKKIKDYSSSLCKASHSGCQGNCVRIGHVISEENPADYATRGCPAVKLQTENHIWWTGPPWLKIEEIHRKKLWNPGNCSREVMIEAEQENRPQPVLFSNVKTQSSSVIDFSRFSKMNILIRTTAYVRRFIHVMMNRAQTSTIARAEKAGILARSEPMTGDLTGKELLSAERTVYRHYQKVNGVHEKEAGCKALYLFKDQDDIYRCGFGRLQNSDLPISEMYPIYIPGHHTEPMIGMLVRKAHISLRHAGHNHTIDMLRKRTWITKCRRAVRYWITRCVVCRRFQATPFRYPVAPPLPAERVNRQRPFESIGLDYAGPFTIRNDKELVKAYTLLITCLSTRSVHIEVTGSLSAQAFINAFRRFASRRGAPRLVICDNAPSFKVAQQLFSFDSSGINGKEKEARSSEIKWKFICPHAPWQGGVYERFVGVMKNAMARSFGRRVMDHDEFQTSMVEIEWIINTRPITQLSDDPKDIWRILRPIDILSPGTNHELPRVTDDDTDDPNYHLRFNGTKEAITNMIRDHQRRVDKFWEIFEESYLKSLQGITQASHAKDKRSNGRKPKVGEIVLLKDESHSRSSWAMARIEEISERHATVKLSRGNLVERPLDRLIPLELTYDVDHEVTKQQDNGIVESPNSRPQRKCLSLARDPKFWELMRV